MKIEDLAKTDFTTIPPEKQALYRAHWSAMLKVHKPVTKPKVLPCIHLGPILTKEPCTCGARLKVNVYQCALYKRCVKTQRDRKRFKDPALRAVMKHTCDICKDHSN